MRRSTFAFIAGALVLASACVDDVTITVTPLSPTDTTTPSATTRPGSTTTEPEQSSSTNSPSTPTDTTPSEPVPLATVIADIQSFWSDNLPGVFDQKYTPLPDARIVAMEPTTPSLRCDGERVRYRDVQDNAFAAPCSEGTTVVYDARNLLPSLEDRFGPAAPAVVLAHEWGHVAQFQGGAPIDRVATYVVEQQADCFAGAWAKGSGERLGGVFADAGSLDGLIGALLDFRDAPGDNVLAADAHGSGFDRVRAFQEGYEKGVGECADYLTNPPPTTQIPFTEADFATQGNLDFDAMLPLVIGDLNYFYGKFLPGFTPITELVALGRAGESQSTCNKTVVTADDLVVRYCKPEGTIVYNDDLIQELHTEIGDNATGTLLGLAWAEAARQFAGETPDSSGALDVLRQQACLTGGWFQSVLTNDGSDDTRDPFSFSAGDLDEAVSVFVQFGSQGRLSEPGAVFSTVAALRQGVTGGPESCGVT
ncbi:MAG: hypothetical protein AB7N61_03310 [Acidimicrobiia bacterium]